MRFHRRALVLSAAVAAAALTQSCARMPHRPERQYQLHGVIVRLDAQQQTATIKHDKIEGWMEAMTMEFPVTSKEEFARLKEGQTIRATVFVSDLDYRIEGVRIE